MSLKDELTIFISSCDKNMDLLPLFFDVLERQWNNAKELKIIVNTEKETFSYKDFDIECPCVCKNMDDKEVAAYPWSTRFLETVKSVKTKYMMFVLDDFFLVHKVDEKKLAEMMEEIRSVKKLGAVYLCPILSFFPTDEVDGKKYLRKIGDYVDYKANLVAAIWDVRAITDLIESGHGIWDVEISMRDRSYGKKYKFFSQEEFSRDYIPEFQKPLKDNKVFYFDYKMQIVKGKWSKRFIPFFETLGIEVDYSKRGLIDFNGKEKDQVDRVISFISKIYEEGGRKKLDRCQWKHNYFIPKLSKIKWKIIGLFKKKHK